MRTKIIATIGPSCEQPEELKKLITRGLNIARFNFSHCSAEKFVEQSNLIRKLSKNKVKILQDLQGPRIRVGKLPANGVELTEGQEVIFSTNQKDTSDNCIHINDPYIHLDLNIGDPIYLADGRIELIVRQIKGKKINTEVIRGGQLLSGKGVNAPHTKLTTSGMTSKDQKDVLFGLKNKVDYIALSFAQEAKDVIKLRKIVGDRAKIIAKIENAISLQHVEEIIHAADGIMIARGDLGIELPMEKIPYIQRHLLRICIWHNKPVIVATQMLTSMINHPHPTRAEVCDIAYAVLDGADALMLSDETAMGQYPIEALATLVKVAQQAETDFFYGLNKL